MILGHDRPLAVLRAALSRGRMHHAWILSGPTGVGKRLVATEIAKVLLDPHAAPNLLGELEADPDGDVAQRVDHGNHPDFHLVRKELAQFSDDPDVRRRKLVNFPLDVLRQFVIGGPAGDGKHYSAPAYRSPQLGHGKVFVVDEVELIDVYGQNAFLKTLEEPPPRTWFFLVTTAPERLLPTIHSRCQHVRFGPLDDAAMRTWFDRRLPDVPADERAWLAAYAEGAPGEALLAHEHGFHGWARELEPMLDDLDGGAFPVDLGDAMAKLVDDFAAQWVKAHDGASKEAANVRAASCLVRMLAARLRPRLLERADDERALATVLEQIDLLHDAERQLASHVNLKHVLENLAVQWTRAVHVPNAVV